MCGLIIAHVQLFKIPLDFIFFYFFFFENFTKKISPIVKINKNKKIIKLKFTLINDLEKKKSIS